MCRVGSGLHQCAGDADIGASANSGSGSAKARSESVNRGQPISLRGGESFDCGQSVGSSGSQTSGIGRCFDCAIALRGGRGSFTVTRR